MSGPKVVRIVTREELIDICRGHIAQVENALSECERTAVRNKVISDSEVARWRAGFAHLEQLLSQDKFTEVQKQSPRLIDSMRHELSQKIEAMYTAEAAARRRESSLRNTARQLQKQLESAELKMPAELTSQLQAAVAGQLSTNQLEAVVASALRSLPMPSQPELTTSQQETLRALAGDAKVRNFSEWLVDSHKEHPKARQLDRYLGQLAACEATDSFQELSSKAEAAYQEIDERRRHLLLDSLCLEAATLVRSEQRQMTIRQAAADERAAIRVSGDNDACREALLRLDQSLAQRQYDVAEREIQELQQLRAEAARQRAARTARIALLQGLQEMGYAVNEGMATIWGQQRSLVVRHPQQRGIAVELGAFGQSNQFQARVVAVQGERRDGKSDLEAETEWCESLAKIQSKIVQCGGELNVERAIAAGKQPLKTVQHVENYADDAIGKTELRTFKNQI